MVYIVWYYDFSDGKEFCGVFSTKEKAQAHIDKSTDDKQNFEISPQWLDSY